MNVAQTRLQAGLVAQPTFASGREVLPYQSIRLTGPKNYEPDHMPLLIDGRPSAPEGRRRLAGRRVDAVAVPASRRPENLLEAARVARVASRLLIILCSQKCEPEEVRQQLAALQPCVPVLIVDVADVDMIEYVFPDASNTFVQAPMLRWISDTAIKRNVALLLSRKLGLQHVLFLDDDVRAVDEKQVKQAVAALRRDGHRAAGWTFQDFPDNSAVSHAYRLDPKARYGPQGCFIGGGGLLVAIDDKVPHFPRGIYNEDWLFLFPMLMYRQVAHLGSLSQLPYDPFGIPAVALRQEFGDLVAEGLFWLLGRYRADPEIQVMKECVSLGFWAGLLARRRAFLVELSAILRTAAEEYVAARRPCAPSRDPQRARKSVLAALEVLDRINASDLQEWAIAWQRDEARWRQRWTEVSGGSWRESGWTENSLDDRLAELLNEVGLKGRVELVMSKS